MSDLFGNHIVGFPTRRLIYSCRFVRFLCEPDADRAAKEMNNMKLEDRHISVKRCGTSTPKTGGALEKTGNQTRKGKGKKSGGRNSETGLIYLPWRFVLFKTLICCESSLHIF